MREVKRSALIAESPARMYALINDIDRYPEFVPWCTAARVESRKETEVVATLTIKRGPLRAEFTTRNLLEPGKRVLMQFVSGPFSVLEGLWTLTPLGDLGCRVELEMRFEFANRVAGTLFAPLFEDTAASLVDAFVKRARETKTN
ncbi:MAG TPA: type II toxin-antitoxin system RatA family toxin [Steroidobacteraceae bacterium]|jgi:ribosome-associated toxin RatA of RatAB toxin-antitoxin module|nr:type II toxin-antitoxin system RatA family toxin [Steroidobacteraceae bacterium]